MCAMHSQQQYFWGCKLDTTSPEETWVTPDNIDSSSLRIIQVVLGEQPGQERNVIKVRTKGYNSEDFDQAMFNLQLGKAEQVTTDLYFQGETTFQLASGCGPVYLSGYQCLVPPVIANTYDSITTPAVDLDGLGDNDNSMKRRHSESDGDPGNIPKNMKLIKMSRINICNNIKMDPRNPEGLTDLWIGNVHPDVTEEVLKELFGRYGRVVSCHIIAKKYCAFINYAQKESAGKAMGALQNQKFYGVPLVVKFPEKRGGVGGAGGGVMPPLMGHTGPPPPFPDVMQQDPFNASIINAAAAALGGNFNTGTKGGQIAPPGTVTATSNSSNSFPFKF